MFSQFPKIFKALNRFERVIFGVSGLVFLLCAFLLALGAFERATVRVAVAGGTYTEGIQGQPIYINPVLSGTNDADRDLVRLVFSSVYDVAEKIEASKDGKTWTVRILDNAYWHDGEPLTSDDVIFTIQSIQDPESRSPLQNTLQDISITRVSERELTMTLPTPYAFFEDNLKNIYIVPKHIFESVPVANWRLSAHNLEPIGSGPYKIVSSAIQRNGFISEIALQRNDAYFKAKPLIENVVIKFFKSEDELLGAFNNAQIDGFMITDARGLSKVHRGHQAMDLPTTLYYALFFNQSAHPALKDKNVRLALNYAIQRSALLDKVLGGSGIPVYGPLQRFLAHTTSTENAGASFSVDEANKVLDQTEWKRGTDGMRYKDKTALEFRLSVPEYPSLVEAASFIQESWKEIGVKTNIEVLAPADINRELIRSRNYEMILFGNSLLNPDLFSFWHSSERFYPGLNLALFENKAADKLIESIRKNFDETARMNDLASLDSLITQNLPAVFLYSPDYTYVTMPNFGGMENELLVTASDRFNSVEKWYVKTALNLK